MRAAVAPQGPWAYVTATAHTAQTMRTNNAFVFNYRARPYLTFCFLSSMALGSIGSSSGLEIHG